MQSQDDLIKKLRMQLQLHENAKVKFLVNIVGASTYYEPFRIKDVRYNQEHDTILIELRPS